VDDYLTTLNQERMAYGMNNEILWVHFKAALDNTFEDTNKIDNAATNLEKLQMADSLTKYISKFNKLRRKVGWDTDVEGTMCYFHRGLTKGLLYSMLSL
jgi:Retrotransposon gag protein